MVLIPVKSGKTFKSGRISSVQRVRLVTGDKINQLLDDKFKCFVQ